MLLRRTAALTALAAALVATVATSSYGDFSFTEEAAGPDLTLGVGQSQEWLVTV